MKREDLRSWSFPYCPEPPDWSLEWDEIVDRFEWVRAMDGCEQDSHWHAEGDVLLHTRLVCESLVGLAAWRALPAEERSILFAAALMHDIAKPVVTRIEDGRVRAPYHGAKGAKIVRSILMTGLLPTSTARHFQLREKIVHLVRHHGVPLYFIDSQAPERKVLGVSQVIRCDWLAMIALVDVMGRVSEDRDRLFERVELFREFCSEQECLDSPRRFASRHTRFLYFRGRDVSPDSECFDDTRLTVTMMSGLPASGKDRWIATSGLDWPVVSLDSIRDELKISPTGNQGAVAARAKELARQYLRSKTSFIWNATNLTLAMRSQLIQLFRDYHAAVNIVYTESAWEDILRRNGGRDEPVPESVLGKMAAKLEVPDVRESHAVDYQIE